MLFAMVEKDSQLYNLDGTPNGLPSGMLAYRVRNTRHVLKYETADTPEPLIIHRQDVICMWSSDRKVPRLTADPEVVVRIVAHSPPYRKEERRPIR